MHWTSLAFSLALPKTGKRMAARIAIIAMTTKSSIKVKPFLFNVLPPFVLFFRK
jgi:hypothetical protein